MKKLLIQNLGCKLNQAEAFQFSTLLKANGIADLVNGDSQNADLILINGCAVTCQAEAKTRQAVSKMVKKFPQATVMVSGCYAQHTPSEAAKLPGVDYVIGLDARQNIDWWKGFSKQPVIEVEDESLKITPLNAVYNNERSRPFIKIQDGCNKKCTFCVIPSIRGRSRSLGAKAIIDAANSHIMSGADEIVLTGVRIGSWGRDLDPPSTLADLVTDIRDHSDVRRIRLGSIEPWELSDRLSDLIVNDSKVCSHLHVPLQHTHPAVLKRMGRPRVDKVIGNLKSFKQRNPNIGIGTDIIVGFPGETEAEFEQLWHDLTDSPFSYMHVFTYSPRPDTVAGRRTDFVEPAVMKKRSRALIELGKQKREAFKAENVDEVAEVIADSGHVENEYVMAVTDNYLRVKIKTSDSIPGRCITAKLDTDESNNLLAQQYNIKDGNQKFSKH